MIQAIAVKVLNKQHYQWVLNCALFCLEPIQCSIRDSAPLLLHPVVFHEVPSAVAAGNDELEFSVR